MSRNSLGRRGGAPRLGKNSFARQSDGIFSLVVGANCAKDSATSSTQATSENFLRCVQSASEFLPFRKSSTHRALSRSTEANFPDRRGAGEIPGCKTEIADGASDRGSCLEGNDRVSIKMVRNVPTCVERPTDCDRPIVIQSSIGEEGNDGAEAELPEPESTAQIGCAGARQKYGAEPLPRWLGSG